MPGSYAVFELEVWQLAVGSWCRGSSLGVSRAVLRRGRILFKLRVMGNSCGEGLGPGGGGGTHCSRNCTGTGGRSPQDTFHCR